jgi:SNF2 family DNA or RNA helicase
VLITGRIGTWERQHNLDAFQRGEIPVLLFTVKAGGTGLTMTATDTMVRLQRSWSMIDNAQAEDRIHRIGAEQHESIHIIDLVTSDTIEGVQMSRLLEKRQRLEEITRTRETLLRAGKPIAELDAEAAAIMNSLLV